MIKLIFSIEINADKEKVWNTLWDDKTFRDWASIIDEGTYLKGELEEGNEVEFISSVGGYGVSSLIEKFSPNECVIFRHSADTKGYGNFGREKEWTGGMESYFLVEKDGITILTVESEIPVDLVETFKDKIPKSLERIKLLSEKKLTKTTTEHDARVAKMIFAQVYPFYVAKIEKKGRTKEELHQVISWLTGFDEKEIQNLIDDKVTFETFFQKAKLNSNTHLITGAICGYRIEEIENPLTKKVRYLDKLVDELAKGKSMEKILRK